MDGGNSRNVVVLHAVRASPPAGRVFTPRRVLFRWDDRLEGDAWAQARHLDHLIGALSWLRERLAARRTPLTRHEVYQATRLVQRAGWGS